MPKFQVANAPCTLDSHVSRCITSRAKFYFNTCPEKLQAKRIILTKVIGILEGHMLKLITFICLLIMY